MEYLMGFVIALSGVLGILRHEFLIVNVVVKCTKTVLKGNTGLFIMGNCISFMMIAEQRNSILSLGVMTGLYLYISALLDAHRKVCSSK